MGLELGWAGLWKPSDLALYRKPVKDWAYQEELIITGTTDGKVIVKP